MVSVRSRSFRGGLFLSLGCLLVLLAWAAATTGQTGKPQPADLAAEYTTEVRPLLKQYCFTCHCANKKKGDLNLERFTSLDQIRKEVSPWQAVVEMLENGAMPPAKSPQLSEDARRKLLGWGRGLLTTEARAHAGDPGRVVVRRLSNAEYNNTIRDLTSIDLQPARDFPIDGAAGEGFTNAGDALATSSTLLNKYLAAAKEITSHTVLLPEGFRFSPAKTRRDWTDEVRNSLRAFYARYSSDGKLPLRPYLLATIRHREELDSGRITLEAVAQQDKINLKYLRILWQTLHDKTPSFPLDRIRARWRQAKPEEVDALVADIAGWQGVLWRFVPIGSYRYGNTIRQLPNEPRFAPTHPIKVPVKPAPGQKDVVLYLVAREASARPDGSILWHRPRLEGEGKPPLLLRDYAAFGARFELDYRVIFADTVKYLDAAAAAANEPTRTADELARRHSVDAALLQRWIDLLGMEARERDQGRPVPAVALELLDAPTPKREDRPAINGWRQNGTDLPVLVANASNQVDHIPGRVSPHGIAVHPTPTQFVAAAWKSPLEGKVRIQARVAHAHPACGNGVAWWLEHRRADRAFLLAEGAVDLGKEAAVRGREVKVGKGDLVILAVDPRDGNHVCDLTEIALTITETDKPERVWDLAGDVADNVLAGNPHADKRGNADVWRFVRGPLRPLRQTRIPPASLLDRWRRLAADPKQAKERENLARQVQELLLGARPSQEKHPDRLLYDSLLSLNGPLLRGMDLARLPKSRAAGPSPYGLDRERFGRHPQGQPADEASLVVPANSVLEVRLPAPLFQDRAFVVEGRLDAAGADRVVQFQVLTSPPKPEAPFDGTAPLVAASGSAAAKRLLEGYTDFRRCFPSFLCYSRVIPDDEVVCLKLFHREDDHLIRLFLDEEQTKQVDRLWRDLRFISRYPVTEHNQLPQFIGYVTQDSPKELVAFFESQREPFRKRAEAFLKDEENAIPKQLNALLDFAARAYRRPLQSEERTELAQLHDTLRKKGMSHEEAFRTVLTRVLISPSFLFRIERAAPGKEAQPVSSWELATRLSYFLWATMPDEELRQAAAQNALQDPKVLAAQVARMLKDPKVRGLASEFGTQWLHVRDIQQNREKNEKLFPTFDDNLRAVLYEEAVLFCQDLFQEDRQFSDILDADYTFLNETLARHYGIPGVAGPQWRRVTGVRKYGRGGVLALGSVLTKQSGASRTSPVLRGNWLVETMFGEKLPKPPPNVPLLPEEETGSEGTVRQMVERHARIAECAVCHQRIDPFGFSLENYDPIGRFRAKDLGGRPIDTKVRLKDGTTFEGIDGLRHYLVKQRGEEFERHFCRKLLGYALGRSVILSDQPLLEEMMEALRMNDLRLTAAVQTIVRSKQFRYHRGLEATKDE